MNVVVIYGKIVSKIEFKFIYDRYKNTNKKENYIENKYKHTSIAKCMLKLQNDSVIEIYGYDSIADYMYKYLKENESVLVEGKIDSDMNIFLYGLNYNTNIRKI